MKKEILGFLGAIAIDGGIVLGSATFNEAKAEKMMISNPIKKSATYLGGGRFDCSTPGQCVCMAA